MGKEYKKSRIAQKSADLNWNHLRIIQTVPGQHTGKAQSQGTAESSHTGHCKHRHTVESTDVKVRNSYYGK